MSPSPSLILPYSWENEELEGLESGGRIALVDPSGSALTDATDTMGMTQEQIDATIAAAAALPSPTGTFDITSSVTLLLYIPTLLSNKHPFLHSTRQCFLYPPLSTLPIQSTN